MDDKMPVADLSRLWDYAYSLVKEGDAAGLAWFDSLPKPSEVTDTFFLTELAWVVYNAGFRESTIRAKWDGLTEAFQGFNVACLVLYPDEAIRAAMSIFANKGKARAVLDAAEKVWRDSPIGKRLSILSTEGALGYLESYPYIGPVTKYHLGRNIGFDVVKPDRHLVRLAGFCGYSGPDELCAVLSGYSGLKVGVVDFVLWRWLSWQGSRAYRVAGELLGRQGGNGTP